MIRPGEAKQAPIRPMPDEIFNLVQVGLVAAEEAKNFKDIVVEEDLPEEQADFENINNDISASLKSGEKFLSEAEAKRRREKILAQKNNGG